MQLSSNFWLSEFTRSETALEHGLDNAPDEEAIENLTRLSRDVLQPLRDRFGALIITSGYRSEEVNRLVGGSPSSDHRVGRAADFYSPAHSGRKMAVWAMDHLPFDQLIYYGWRLHVGYRGGKEDNRAHVLTYFANAPDKYRHGLLAPDGTRLA